MQGAAQEFDGWVVDRPAEKPVISQEQQTGVLSSNQCKYDALEFLISA
jgi:hypothetical protein